MPGKPGRIVVGIFTPEIVKQKEGIEFLRGAETEGTAKTDTGSFQSRLRLNDTFDWAD
jgi:hypothetical protein